MMFELTASYLNASWWTVVLAAPRVEVAMCRDGGRVREIER